TGFVMKNWRGEKHPRFVETSPGAPAVKLAIGERRRIVYVGLTRAKDALYVTATREEVSPREVGANGLEDHDHVAEILSWALAHPRRRPPRALSRATGGPRHARAVPRPPAGQGPHPRG